MKFAPQSLIRSARLPLFALALCGSASAQTTFYVDDNGPGDPFPGVSIPGNTVFSDPLEDGSSAHPFDDLYKAVDVAVNGDTVLVLPSDVIGYYALSSSLDLDGKAITVVSSGGPQVTALDGSGIPGVSGVLINSGESSTTVFEGLTLQNFDRGSSSGSGGGGMFVSGASPTIRDCVFENNHAYVGGGLYLNNSSARIEGCSFVENSVIHQGAGVFSNSGSQDFESCTFDSNQASFGAGALFRTNSADIVEFDNCLFIDNTALGNYGGGLAKFDQGKIEVRRSTFVGNTSADVGSAMQVHGGGFVHECLFVGNAALTGTVNLDNGGSGGAGTLDVFGSTFSQNVGGSLTELAGNAVLRNSISWNNSPFEVGGSVTVTYSNVLGGFGGAGNIDSDPRFRNPFGPDGVLGTLDDDLRLKRNSPCIDAADTVELHRGPAWANAILVGYPTDIRGEPRAVDAPNRPDVGVASLGQTVDMGAFEYQPQLKNCNEVVNPQQYP